MSKRHKRTWTVIGEGLPGATSGYRAWLVKLESERTAGSIFTLVDWLTGPTGISGFDPRFRILVGTAADTAVGVREARSLGRANNQLIEVDRILHNSTADEARRILGLDPLARNTTA